MRKILFLLILLSSSILVAQTEDDFDREFLDNDRLPLSDEKKGKLDIEGFIQASYQQAVPFTGSGSQYQVVKIEERGHLDALWSYGFFSGKAAIDAFYYPSHNFKRTIPHNRVDIPEIYFQGGENFRFKVGIQKFSWGSSELFRLTRYFSRYDLSEFLAKDFEDINKGVGALAVKYIFNDLSLEAVWSPFHSPMILPEGYWEIKDTKPYPSDFISSDSMDYDIKKSSAGLRFGGTVKDVDVFVSYFNGYSSNSLMSSTVHGFGIEPGDDSLFERYDKVIRENSIEYFRVNSIGFELSAVIKKFTLKFETVITPDMLTAPGVTDENVDDAIMTLPDGDSTVKLTRKERVPYLAFTVGSDVNLWGRNGMVLLEWTQGMYLKNITRYSYPATSYLLLLMLQDSFLDKRLIVRGGTLIRPVSLQPGGLVVCESAWKFSGNFELSLRGSFFFGNSDPLFKFYERKHLLELKVRYMF